MNIVQRTAERLGISPRFIFRRATEAQHWSNEDECFRYRFERYVKYGEVPPYVENYCHQTEAAILAVGQEKVDVIAANGERVPLFV